MPAPMSATATPSSRSVSFATASAEARALTTSSSIFTPAWATHFMRFWIAVWGAVTMWVSTSSRRALIPSGSLTPSWPSTVKPRRSTWRTSRFDGIGIVRACSTARRMSSRLTSRVWAATDDLAGRVEALDLGAADADEGLVDLPARQPLGPLDGVADRADGLLDVDDRAALQPRRRHRAVADDREPAVAPDLADQRADLARADVECDEDPFYHALPQMKCRRMRATLLKIRKPNVISATRYRSRLSRSPMKVRITATIALVRKPEMKIRLS